MPLNPGLAFQMCWGTQDWLRWECWVLIMVSDLGSVSKILTSAIRHLVISGVSCYSCLWLELIPLVILLASTSRPGRLALSWVSVFRAFSAGKLSSCWEGAQISGVWTCLLEEARGKLKNMSNRNQNLVLPPQKALDTPTHLKSKILI